MADRKERALNLQCLARLPVTASETVQLDRGHLGLTSSEVRGRDSFIIRVRRQIIRDIRDVFRLEALAHP
jgi:hypothetical protein